MGRLTQETESSGLTLSYAYDSAGNRSSMAASGTENYNKTYTYDGNNCIGYVVRHNGITTESVSYTHDANGNMLSETVSGGAYTGYTYNNFNQLTSTTNSNGTYTYSYNPQGIRTGKQANLTAISYLLDGGNVVAEQYGGTIDSTYLRGTNLISRTRSHSKDYYLYNAHGDVVNLTDPSGTVTKTYAYDAFGNEKVKDIYDSNPFRYCGEYYDTETGKYYLRARYYDPINGRFTQPDTHWNPANMIYGDNPQKINERQDALGITHYSYRPHISAILQSGNLYVYAINDPIRYADRNGKESELAFALFEQAKQLPQVDGPYPYGDVLALGTLVLGGIIWFGDEALKLAQESITELVSAITAAGAPDPDDWDGLSKNKIKHITNRHNPHKTAQEMKFLSRRDAVNKLKNRTFFNKNWSSEQIADAVNTGYRQAMSSGIKSGKYSFQYLGEKVTLHFERGVLKTAYGHCQYTVEELLLLLG